MYELLCRIQVLCNEIEAETVNRECSDYKDFYDISKSVEALLTIMEER